MIGIDTAFFLLELIIGIIVHSLALTADAFHMVCLAQKLALLLGDAQPVVLVDATAWLCDQNNNKNRTNTTHLAE